MMISSQFGGEAADWKAPHTIKSSPPGQIAATNNRKRLCLPHGDVRVEISLFDASVSALNDICVTFEGSFLSFESYQSFLLNYLHSKFVVI